ncbi:DUF4255 domain-containing protein [Sediminibacterium goheungense]|uniref:Uncharacterized protein DUF4255 n=1 Tax=Sediminibacterium goheungense TaxID=1086393 RepID=A0A4R6IT32_9BACT|nr:DUF4255 domain-containing protein [Sediminibacterium goheungense]TDO25669.1 uncharacterized protein DUF4255 [Sediminibacterium goheungense]
MIYESLNCVAEELNEYFRSKLRISEDKVVLSGIVNQDGTIAIQGENKVLITLINTEKEPSVKSNASAGGARTFANTSSAMSVNLYVLFSSYFTGANYPEALRFLSFVIAFLQEKNVFSLANTPRLDPSIEKLTFEMESLSSEKLNNVWATLGAKYMPSVVYKIRMLTFDSSVIREYRPAVAGVERASDAV